MLENLPKTKRERLEKLGIRHFDDLIHDQPREWLIKYFKSGSSAYPINVAKLVRG